MSHILAAIVATLGAILGTAGILGLLQFFNTRKSVRKKTDSEAQVVFDEMMENRLKNAYSRIEALENKDALRQIREDKYTELFWDMMKYIEDNVPNNDVATLAEFHAKINAIRQISHSLS